MTPDLEQYREVIEKLKPSLSEPDFDIIFKSATSKIPKPKQFLIKMELNRLNKPCHRYIDLRGHVDGDIRDYEYDGKTHYMDDVAIGVFEKGLKVYGNFTMGIYDDVMNTDNNYRVRHQKEKEQQKAALSTKQSTSSPAASPQSQPADNETHLTTYGANRAVFSGYAVRAEERMNFSIPIEIIVKPDERINATTSDLSVSGCKVRLSNDQTLLQDQMVTIHFSGLEQEFELGLKKDPQYQVVGHEMHDKYHYVRLKRTFTEDINTFDEFLKNFINGNKRRYKINLDNTEKAVTTKGYEQYYMPRVTHLPVYFKETEDGQLTPHAMLTTENNKFASNYWRDEDNNLVISQVLNHNRVKKLLKKPEGERETLLFCFTHASKGKVYFYTATQDELLASPNLIPLFFGFGATKKSWRVFKMKGHETSDALAWTPLSLPQTASPEIKKLNKPPSGRVLSFLQGVKYIVDLTEILQTEPENMYSAHVADMQQVNKLKQFGHPRLSHYPHTEVVAVEYINLRKETRYLYKTNVSVNGKNEFQATGYTRDFSTRGIQLQLDSIEGLNKGDTLLISFVDLQRITKKYKLTRLPYEIMAIGKASNVVNLKIYDVTGQHVGRLFFQQLIQTNRSKLTAALETPKFEGLSDALRNMYSKVMTNMPFYVHRRRLRFCIDVIGVGRHETSLHQLFGQYREGENDYNIYPLAKSNQITAIFGKALKTLKRQDRPKCWELFIQFKRGEQEPEKAFVVAMGHKLAEFQKTRQFIQRAITMGDMFFCYQIFLSRTGRPDMEFINNELKYVSTYAIHRAKALEDELWDVCGVGDIVDISDEMLYRYNFPVDTIVKQQKMRERFFKVQALKQQTVDADAS